MLHPLEDMLPQVYTKLHFSFLGHTYYKNSVKSQCLDWKLVHLGTICIFWHITTVSFSKDSELNELRKTIELLKKQNAAAQAAINGVINTPELSCKGEKQALRFMTVQYLWDLSILVISDAALPVKDLMCVSWPCTPVYLILYSY